MIAKNTHIIDVIEKQVNASPDAIALVCGNAEYSYQEIDEAANGLADYLISHAQVKPGDVVGLMAEHSENTIISVLAIWKIGAVLLPVAVNWPAARKKYMLKDAGVKALLLDSSNLFEVDFFGNTMVALDIQVPELPRLKQNIQTRKNAQDLAYILYTSGSTGKPKAVKVASESLVNYLSWANTFYFSNNKGYTFSVFTPLTFDLTFTSIFTTILRGDRQIIYGNIPVDKALYDMFHPGTPVSTVKLTPSHVDLIDRLKLEHTNVSTVILGGEQLKRHHWEILKKYNPEIRIFNEYGPTEATIGCIAKELNTIDDIISIGTPVDKTQVYILNPYSGKQPMGIPGEIHLAGVCLSKGYLNDKPLTDEKFIKNPFDTLPGSLLYKTGDMGKRLPNGEVQFLGRNDDQVKIRGYRIELGEVEQQLIKYPLINNAVVIAVHDHEEVSLCAFFVAEQQLETSGIVEALKRWIPDYMMPATFIQLEELPLTANGKTDKKHLIKLRETHVNTQYTEARSDTEKALVEIWKNVLGVEQPGVTDNFFELGGQSIKAITILTGIYDEFNLELELSDIFDHTTIASIAKIIDAAMQSNKGRIEKVNTQPDYALSHGQRRLWVLEQLEETGSTYTIRSGYRLKGTLDLKALNDSFKLLISRHEILRTVFISSNGTSRQVVMDAGQTEFAVEYMDLTTEDNPDASLRDHIKSISNFRFKLGDAPLLRVNVFALREDDFLLLMRLHHIISDERSAEIIAHEISHYYNAILHGKSPELPALELQYKDYAEWQHTETYADILKKSREYWHGQLAGELPVLDIPADFKRPTHKNYKGETLDFSLNKESCNSLTDIGKRKDSTLFMVLLSLVKVFLYRYTGQDDIIIGTTVIGRNTNQLADQIGFYINMLPIRLQVDGNHTFYKALEGIRRQTLDAYDHQTYPFDQLVEDLNIKRDMSRSPVFDVLVTLVDTKVEDTIQLENLEAAEQKIAADVGKYDLSFYFVETADNIDITLEYSSQLFKRSRIVRIRDYFLELTESVINDVSDTCINSLNYLPASEKELLINTYNQTDTLFNTSATIHGLFRKQAALWGTHTAVLYQSKKTSYLDLKTGADRVSHHLEHFYGIGKGAFVGVLMDRSPELLMCLMGIMQLGGCYVPMDPDFPSDRILYLLEDSGAKHVIANDVYRSMIDKGGADVIVPSDINFDSDPSFSFDAVHHDASSPMYMIYTSGSTGHPKGAAIPHLAVVNLFDSISRELDIGSEERWLAHTTISFDISIPELFLPLVTGNALLLTSNQHSKNPAAIVSLIKKEKATVMSATPSMWRLLLGHDWSDVSRLRIMSSGEEMDVALGLKLLTTVSKDFWNLYGPTETTVWSTIKRVAGPDDLGSIGRPLANTQLYILDKSMELAAHSASGELYIGGVGLAIGYHNREALNAERFLANPFKPGDRIYRSGDLTKWNDKGELVFLGRGDDQLKLRGYRIESGEIAFHLEKYPGVDHSLAMIRGSGMEQSLVAYYKSAERLSSSELRDYLADRLPAYMVPDHLLWLTSFPKTANGKVDRKKLPLPVTDELPDAGNSYEAPDNATESALQHIWESVLKLNGVGVTDNFFELGGHSLKAIQILGRVEKELDRSVELKTIFLNPTIRQLAKQLNQGEKASLPEIKPVKNEKNGYKLSPGQERIWILSQFEGANQAYNINSVFELKGDLNEEKLAGSFEKIVARHEILRTNFALYNGEPRQFIEDTDDALKIDFSVHGREGEELNEQEALEYIEAELLKPFDLQNDSLLRIRVYHVGKKRYLLQICIHHIVSDGWSVHVLMDELMKFYNAATDGREPVLSQLKIQYKDFAYWQSQLLQGDELESHRQFWHHLLREPLSVLNIAGERLRPPVKNYRGSSEEHTFSRPVSQGIQKYATKNESSLFAVLLSMVNLVFYKYTGQRDIIVGTTSAGRIHTDLGGQLGYYINNLVLRNQVVPEQHFTDLLAHVEANLLDAQEHEVYPFDRLVDELPLERDLSRSPIYDVLVEFQNFKGVLENESDEVKDLTYTPYKIAEKFSQVDINIMFNQRDEDIEIRIVYNPAIYGDWQIRNLIAHIELLGQKIPEDDSGPIGTCNLLLPSEKERIDAFNKSYKELTPDTTFLDIFHEMAAMHSDKTAVVHEHTAYTYRQLDEATDTLCNVLLNSELTPEEGVVVLLDRSVESLIALIGIMKAGAAYVPLETSFPLNRIMKVLEDLSCRFIVTSSHYINNEIVGYITEKGAPSCIICMDDHQDGKQKELPVKHIKDIRTTDLNDSKPVIKPDNLAYIIYTSGSTGAPKGVMIEHLGMLNHLYSKINELRLNSNSSIVQNASATFDISIWQFLSALMVGGKTVIYDQNVVLKPNRLIDRIKKERITILEVVPSYLNVMLELLEKEDKTEFPNLQYLVVTGETLNRNLVERWFTLYPGIKVVNAYGPTEASDDITHHIMEKAPGQDIVPIGKVVQNLNIHILDDYLQSCPIGVKGELCVSGIGVGRGYWNDEVKTGESFIDDPFHQDGKMYKTGDLARYLNDGTIEFYGRKDNQVKIRGNRIELGEIEHKLSRQTGISEAAVLLKKQYDQDPYLVAYVSTVAEDITADRIQQHLKTEVPEYMIPAKISILSALPLTHNGKVDRKALLGLPEGEIEEEYQAPGSSAEEALQSIWNELLNKEQVSVTANFFDLGGHSLTAIRLITRVQQELFTEIGLRDIFEYPTIRSIASFISQKDSNDLKRIQPAGKAEFYPVSHGQRRLWTLAQLSDGFAAYNIPTGIIIKGRLDRVVLRKSISTMVRRHESLRTVFKTVDGLPYQQVQEFKDAAIEIDFTDLTDADDKDTMASAIANTLNTALFDLENGPLFKCHLIQKTTDEYLFLVVLHHIISDGWSMDVLVREFYGSYAAHINGNASPFDPLRIHYKDYAIWQNENLAGNAIARSRDYWLQEFSGEIPVLSLPQYTSRPAHKTYNGAWATTKINAELTASLMALSKKNDSTLFMTMLASVNVLLYVYSGQDDIILGIPAAGRPQKELEDQIGLYINTLALRSKVDGTCGFNKLLQDVKEKFLGAFEHQGYPFDLLVEELNPERNLSRSPLFDVMVVQQNVTDSDALFTMDDLDIYEYTFKSDYSKYDLTFNFTEVDREIVLNINYNTDLFTKHDILEVSERFKLLLSCVVRNEESPIDSLEYLSSLEKKEQLSVNTRNKAYGKEAFSSVIARFEAGSVNHGNAIATSFNGVTRTYVQLNTMANGIAHYLRDTYSTNRGAIIGIMTERSDAQIAAILGVMKTGAAYLPLHSDIPVQRLKTIIEESGMAAVLCDETTKDRAPDDLYAGVVNIEAIMTSVNGTLKENLTLVNEPEDDAYIIYTSGSSGKPKGVRVSHRALLNYEHWFSNKYKITVNDSTLLMSSVAFDLTYTSLWSCLIRGGRLVILPEEKSADQESIIQYLIDHKITYVKLTPFHLRMLVLDSDYEQNIKRYSLRLLVCGGESIDVEDVEKFIASRKDTMVVNHYGPTETTIGVLTQDITYDTLETFKKEPVLGTPIANTNIYILNNSGYLVPRGVLGEICVGGAALSSGYINNGAANSEKFVADNYLEGAQIYRTNDLGYWNRDGKVCFAGRKDDQLKIRGYRIEPLEIARTLLAHPNIDNAYILADETAAGDKILVAFYVAGASVDPDALKEYLKEYLPVYMLPTFYIALEHIPVTHNGKVDRRALSALSKGRINTIDYEAPESVLQEQLVEAWEQILGRSPIGIRDNFFASGGDSIKAIQVTARLRSANLKLKTQDIFEEQTIENIAKKVTFVSSEIDQSEVYGALPLTPVQHQFFENDGWPLHHYNQAVLLRSEMALESGMLERAFGTILSHHDALRIRFKKTGDSVLQYNEPWVDTGRNFIKEFDYKDKTSEEVNIASVFNDLHRSFDLEKSPLLSVALFHMTNEDLVFIAIHHLVMDGISWRIILSDLESLINAYRQGTETRLPKKTNSYKEWSQGLLNYAKSNLAMRELDYWKTVVVSNSAPVPVDTDADAPLETDFKSENIVFSEQHTEFLLTSIHKAYSTEINDILLTALSIAFHKTFNINKVLIEMEGHGREPILPGLDINRTVGWFTSKYPVLLEYIEGDISRQIIEVKETIRKIPNKGIGFGILKYLSANNAFTTANTRAPEISFNYLGQVNETFGKSDFSLMRGASGDTISDERVTPFLIEVGSIVLENRLDVAFKYSNKHFKAATIKLLAGAYTSALMAIIDHVSKLKGRQLTPSDVSDVPLAVDDFNSIFE